jgi:CTP synthase (UTP-ammonia lyase)
MQGALNAIRVARESDLVLIGTCGGFQHIVLEYAQNVLGIEDASHEEYDPYASRLFLTRLACSLVGKTMQVFVEKDSLAFHAYGRAVADEHYYCNFGLNPEYRAQLHEAGLRVVGTDQDGEARIVEISWLRFFVGTLFVPQTSSTPEHPHPLILAYLEAARKPQAAVSDAAAPEPSPSMS